LGDALIFAAGFGGTVGVEVVDEDVGSRVVWLELSAGALVGGSMADETAVGTVTDAVGAAADVATD